MCSGTTSMSAQRSSNLSLNRTKLELNSPAAQEDAVELSVPQTHSPFSVSNRTVLDICSHTKQHSKGLLTPCRQVGLSRKSPRNSVSSSSIDLNHSTPRSLSFVPSVRNSKGLGKFNVNVFDKYTPEEETSEVLGKRINLENINLKAKQCKYELEEELIHDKHDKGTKKKKTGNFNNKGQQNSTDVLSHTVSNIQSNLNDERNMMCPESGGGEMSTEKTNMGNLINAQKCSVDTIACEDLGFTVSDTNSVIISKSTNGGKAIKANQVKNWVTPTEQCHVHTLFHKDSDFLSNSRNEDSITNYDNMIEYSEQNFKILKQQITVKEEEVKRLKLILLYKKKVMCCIKANSFCHFMFIA